MASNITPIHLPESTEKKKDRAELREKFPQDSISIENAPETLCKMRWRVNKILNHSLRFSAPEIAYQLAKSFPIIYLTTQNNKILKIILTGNWEMLIYLLNPIVYLNL